MESVIKHISHPYPAELYQARRDQAHITNQTLVEHPWWYEDLEAKYLYHDLYACIGWPSEVADNDLGLPGYAGIVGVIRPPELTKEERFNPIDAKFLLLAEVQTDDVPTLLKHCLQLREKYGFGIQPNLLTVWFGDPKRFATTLALANERLYELGGSRNEILVSPPDDFYTPMVFDNYVRSLKSCLQKGDLRFYFGDCDILKNKLREFVRDDPAVMAAGGLVHSLLSRCMWMDETQGSTVFNVEEAV